MKVVSIGDLVTDFYYKDGKFLGVNGGMTSHNIIANLSIKKINTAVFGVCGNDIAGKIAIKALADLKVDVNNVEIIDDIRTRCFHISYFNENDSLTFTSKKRCPFCGTKKWYDESLIDSIKIISKLNKDDILVFDNLNMKNQQIIDKVDNIKMLDLGQYFELDNYTDAEIINKLKNKFKIINLNERVEKYLLKRFNLVNLLDIYDLIKPELLIITRGEVGASFVFNGIIIDKKLNSKSIVVDSTGAGDAFFSVFIYEYIMNKFTISKEYINKCFVEATRLTSKVVKQIGARSHLSKLYKIKKKADVCICDNFELCIRKKIKRCNININNLEIRALNSLKSGAYNIISKIDFSSLNSVAFIGTGGSFAAANFSSRVINDLYGVNTITLYPRDLLHRNVQKIDKVFLFSYSGTTNDVIEGCKKIDSKNKYIITKGEKQKIVSKTGVGKENIISYRSGVNKASEKGFLSFEGAISPALLFLKLYIEKKGNSDVIEFVKESFYYWNNYFKNYFEIQKELLNEILIKGNTFNIFTGDYVTSACIDLESKIVESGIFNVLIHEKKNFSHGRFINYEHISQKINIYFKQNNISDYEEKLIKYLNNKNMIIIESKYNGILCEFDLLVASQFLIYYISNFLNIDVSKPEYSDESMGIYFYSGNL